MSDIQCRICGFHMASATQQWFQPHNGFAVISDTRLMHTLCLGGTLLSAVAVAAVARPLLKRPASKMEAKIDGQGERQD